MRRPFLPLLASGGLALAGCGDHAAPTSSPGPPPAHSPTEPEELLVLSLPDEEVDAALAVLAREGVQWSDYGGALGVSGIRVAAKDYDKARRAFEASPALKKYICARDCPANGGPSATAR